VVGVGDRVVGVVPEGAPYASGEVRLLAVTSHGFSVPDDGGVC
jgi:hypothetical protein